jgi:DNA-directed RNA polymerase specialized sigma24 family protein
MAEGRTPADFERWVEPHLATLARFVDRRVGSAERDQLVQQALIRAWQRWPAYDGSRGTAVTWLLGIVANEPPRDHTRPPAGERVELVDLPRTDPETRDVDLERAVDGLARRERLAVDLHYFVDLDLATVAAVVHSAPATVEDTLTTARRQLVGLLGDGEDTMDRRLSAAARRWQEGQPPPPEVPLDRLDEPLRRHLPWRVALVAAAAVALLAGGGVAVVSGLGGGGDTPRAEADAPPTASAHRATETVPFRDLDPSHPALGRDQNGAQVTPFDGVSATGDISGTLHPGDTLVFDAALEAPGLVSLLPCPDYTITVGTLTTTRQLNCAQVPYYASLVRSTGKVTGFRPVLPAGTQVFFQMRVTVPDQPGHQQVLWALDGPHAMPGFSGAIEVTPR